MQVACFSFAQVFLLWGHFEKTGWRDRGKDVSNLGLVVHDSVEPFWGIWSIEPTRFHAFITRLLRGQVRNSTGPSSRQTPCTFYRCGERRGAGRTSSTNELSCSKHRGLISEERNRFSSAFLQSVIGSMEPWLALPWQERSLRRAAMGCPLVVSSCIKVHILTLPALSFRDHEC